MWHIQQDEVNRQMRDLDEATSDRFGLNAQCHLLKSYTKGILYLQCDLV